MSDFLTNLLTRSFSQETSVRPLLEPVLASPPLPREERFDPVEEFSDLVEEVSSPDSAEPSQKSVKPARKRGVTRVSSPVVAREPTIENHEPSFPPRESLPTFSPAPISVTQANSTLKELSPLSQVSAHPELGGGRSQAERPPVTPTAGSMVMRKPKSSFSRAEPNSTSQSILQRRVSATTRTADATDLRPGQSPSSTVPVTGQSGVENFLASRTSRLHSRDTAMPNDGGLQIVERFIERPVSPPPPRAPAAFNQRQASTLLTTIVPNIVTIPFPISTKSRSDKSSSGPGDMVADDLPGPETVVNVAIGRIEVRATSPASPKRERQPSGPKVMTLDEYVQQRSRGTQ